MQLQGKTALVTGSTSGIGLAIARALAFEGASVMINGFGDPDEIEEIRRELEVSSGAQALYDGADLGDAAAIEAMIKRCTHELHAPDILVNNAGIQFVSPVESFPVEKWDAILRINLTAVFHTTRLCLPAMRERGWGRIINTASAHSLVASPNKSAYVAAKHGVAGLTKTVALEAARDGVTVNCISPGYVWTPLVENQIPDTMKARGPDPRAGDERRAARRPADQAVRHGRRSGEPRTLSHQRRRRVDHRRQPQHGRRLDRSLTTSSCHPELVSGSISKTPERVEKWMLKQVQHDVRVTIMTRCLAIAVRFC